MFITYKVFEGTVSNLARDTEVFFFLNNTIKANITLPCFTITLYMLIHLYLILLTLRRFLFSTSKWRPFSFSLSSLLKLALLIWRFATEARVLRVLRPLGKSYGWSPTPAPAIIRVCREARTHCSYRTFLFDTPEYHGCIWTKFDHDIIQMHSWLVVEDIFNEKDNVKHLRVDMRDGRGRFDGF